MLMSFDELRGHKIIASDGSLGKATDLFFDDHLWVVRYLVVDTGWLFGRKVLIGTEAIKTIDNDAGEVVLALTKQQIEDGPRIGTDLPVSRQHEITLREHYGWPRYWESFPAGMAAGPLIPPVGMPAGREQPVSSTAPDAEQGDPHLRSAHEVIGYHIEATDGEIGHVEDFVLDDETWTVRYVVVDTRNWLPGRKVLVAPSWAEHIDWPGRSLKVKMVREAIRNGPPYDPAIPMDRDYERVIWEYYGKSPYWV